jgi:phosphatidylglycerophosphatase A
MTRLARAVATFGYVGLIPGPAGTWGSLAALPLGYALHRLGGFPTLALATLLLYGLGYWAVLVEVVDENDLDPSHVVVDEVVGQWIALWPLSLGLWHAGAPASLFPWPGWVFGFLLFRFFDITKLGPVGWADRRKGAQGVMLDDVIAGLFAALIVTLMAAVAHGWLR